MLAPINTPLEVIEDRDVPPLIMDNIPVTLDVRLIREMLLHAPSMILLAIDWIDEESIIVPLITWVVGGFVPLPINIPLEVIEDRDVPPLITDNVSVTDDIRLIREMLLHSPSIILLAID